MKQALSKYIDTLIKSLLFWVVAMTAHTIIRYYGVYEESGIHVSFDFRFSIYQYLKFGLMMGILLGFFYSIIKLFLNKYVSNRLPLWLSSLIGFIIYILVFGIILTYTNKLFDGENATDVVAGRFWWIRDKFFWSTLFYVGFVSIGLSFIRVASERFGTNNFIKILLGKYKKPKEEKRIFMFLDLKDSTTIAENLGHFNYSLFIQDCFYDLNDVVVKYEAEIYQYVGDEAVLTWRFKKGVLRNNCIDLFFAFKKRLEHKATYYQEKYNTTPTFKAGIHGGELMVTEVGSIKKELAFHGDVINTTARIQSLCNEYNQELIISEYLYDALDIPDSYEKTQLGELPLKGKQKLFDLFGLTIKS